MTRKKALGGHRLYVGWDVGAWNCDDNRKSRDALCVLALEGSRLSLVGKPWRKNLRKQLVDPELSGWALIESMLELCGVSDTETVKNTIIAIDTPLGWPTATIDLLARGRSVEQVTGDAGQNPYCFRKTERRSFVLPKKKTPLSVVRDMIGSQSTKGIHFLQKALLRRESVGVWRFKSGRCTTTAIETYPAACERLSEVHKRTISRTVENIREEHKNVRSDVKDAAVCAIIAYMFDHEKGKLASPDRNVPPHEGWIWVPKDCLSAEA